MAVSGTKGVGKGPFGAFGTGNGIPEGTGAIRTGSRPKTAVERPKTAKTGQNRPEPARVYFQIPDQPPMAADKLDGEALAPLWRIRVARSNISTLAGIVSEMLVLVTSLTR